MAEVQSTEGWDNKKGALGGWEWLKYEILKAGLTRRRVGEGTMQCSPREVNKLEKKGD